MMWLTVVALAMAWWALDKFCRLVRAMESIARSAERAQQRLDGGK